MGTVNTCENIFRNTSVFIRRNLVQVGERRNIRRKRFLYEEVELTPAQEKEIQDFFVAHYGKKIPTKWHRLYQSYTGTFRYNYFPEILLSAQLEPLTNPYREAEFLGDKNLLPVLFGNVGGIHVPKTILSCARGILRDKDNNIVTKEVAIKILSELETCVIKKTIDTSSGKDVEIINFSGIDIEKKLNSYGNNYVIQELICQNKELVTLNPSSINTFRVMTYICDDEIHTCPVALRIGRSNADRDNIHYGGICVGVTENGNLRKTAFSEYGERFEFHPDTKIKFEDYHIEEAGATIRKAAKALHCQIPYLGIISWDLTIDANGVVTLIEMNTTGQSAWFCQMVNGEALFGEDTSKMLEKIRR